MNLFKLYLGKSYDNFVLNVIDNSSSCLWDNRLCHVNFTKMFHMSKHEIISTFDIPKKSVIYVY